MWAENRYDIKDTGTAFSFKPNRYSITLSILVLIVLLLPGALLIIFFDKISQGWCILYCVLAPYLILNSLYDILIRSEISYIFDKGARVLYRKIPFLPLKKLMSFDEVLIFTGSTNGYWYYALGAKKTHLIKSYRISEDFRNRKEKSEKLIQYEQNILSKLCTLLEN